MTRSTLMLALMLSALLAACGKQAADSTPAPAATTTPPPAVASAPAVPPVEAVKPAASASPQTFPGQGTTAAGNPADQAVKAASQPK
jgi:predicted outer membrane protein